MVTSVAGVTTPRATVPILTPDMFKNHARAGVQVENLVPKGSPAQQDAALAFAIEQATSWLNTQAELDGLGFAAGLDTVISQVNVNRQGYACLFPRRIPCIGLTACSFGSTLSTMQALSSLEGTVVMEKQIQVPVYPLALTSSQGPIQFGGVPAPADRVFVQYTYCAGFPVTTLTADVSQGAVLLPVAETAGIVAGQTWLTVYALERRFRFLASSVSTADAGGIGTGPGMVGCPGVPQDLLNGADYPLQVSAAPPDLILAGVLATRAFLKQKGAGSVSATSATARSPKEGRQNAGDDLAEAWGLLEKFCNPVGE